MHLCTSAPRPPLLLLLLLCASRLHLTQPYPTPCFTFATTLSLFFHLSRNNNNNYYYITHYRIEKLLLALYEEALVSTDEKRKKGPVASTSYIVVTALQVAMGIAFQGPRVHLNDQQLTQGTDEDKEKYLKVRV